MGDKDNFEVIEVNGIEALRLLSAFQVISMCGNFGCKTAFGVTPTRAKKVIQEITGRKIKRGQFPPNEIKTLEGYMAWLGSL